jgi:DNA-binding beta-propeller fold protein YncE
MPLRSLVALLIVSLAPLAARADAAIPIGDAGDLAVNPITHEVWVTGRGRVYVVDGTTHDVQAIPVAGQPLVVRVDPVRNQIWVVQSDGSFSVIDGATRTVTPLAVAASPGPDFFALDPLLGRMYFAKNGVRSVGVVDAATLDTTYVPITGGALGVVADPAVDGAVAISFDPTLRDLRGFDDGKLIAQRIASDMPAVVAEVTSFPYGPFVVGLSADLYSGRTFIGGSSDGPPITVDWNFSAFLTPSGLNGLSVYVPVAEPTAGRVWGPSVADPLMELIGPVVVIDSSSLRSIARTTTPLLWDRIAVNPATRRAYVTCDSGMCLSPTRLGIIDADDMSVTHDDRAGYGAGYRPAIDVAANRVYTIGVRAESPYGTDLLEWDEPVAAPIPLAVAITAEPVIAGLDPVVHFSATSGFTPHPLPIRQIYWQIDATNAAWSPADARGAVASATLRGLEPGPHVVHAFATDGQEATTSSRVRFPIVGPVASLAIDVPPAPACSNGIDDDGDGLVDFPADRGCASALSNREDPACNDGIDNDGDGLVDFPDDPECTSAYDGDESRGRPACGVGAELVLALAVLRIRRR